jgi:hypothetical protein
MTQENIHVFIITFICLGGPLILTILFEKSKSSKNY